MSSADIIPGISAIPTPCPACADSSMPSIELDEGSGRPHSVNNSVI